MFMGQVYATVTFHGKKGKRVVDHLLVDTGATYTIIPSSLADEIGVFVTPYHIQLTLADASKKSASIGLTEVEVEGRRQPVEIAIVENGVPVLGAQALEVLGFEVNPVKKLEAVNDSGALAVRHLLSRRNPKTPHLLKEACKPLPGAKAAVRELLEERKHDERRLERKISPRC